MDTETLSTRRTFLKAIPAAAAIAGLPAMALAAPASSSQVALAIAVHRRAQGAVTKAAKLIAQIEKRVPGLSDVVRVKIGVRLRGRDDEGNDIRDPHYAYSLEDIEKARAQWVRAFTGFGRNWQQNVADAEARHDRFAAELRKLAAARARLERRCGYTAALEAHRQAADTEGEAFMSLLVRQPLDDAEALQKSRYVYRTISYRDEWLLERHQVHALLSSIAGLVA